MEYVLVVFDVFFCAWIFFIYKAFKKLKIPANVPETKISLPRQTFQTDLIDMTGKEYTYCPSGNLYVKRDPDQEFIPKFAKPLDVGIDLPVKINIDYTKFDVSSGWNEGKPDRLRQVMLYPNLKHFIYPNGTTDDPIPFLEVPAFGWAEVPSAISVKLPDDSWGFVKTRSCTGFNMHLFVLNSTIDAGYIGLLGTLVYNPNNIPVRIHEYDAKTKKGTCLSQLILIPRYDLRNIVLVDKLPETIRSSTGFGSSSSGHLRKD